MHLKVLYHGNCFDGAASAALFGRFLAEREGARLARTSYHPLQHQAGNPFPDGVFDGDVNAVLDFRFSPSPRLHWWFDHHRSAFQPPEDRAAFEADRSGQKFWDPEAPSNAGFLHRTLSERFGWSVPDRAELVRWADLIDAARFPSARAAVRLEEPALRIMTLLEATTDPALPGRIVEGMARGSLGELGEAPWVKAPLAPILEAHARAIAAYERLARLDGGVVEVDLSEAGIPTANKFIGYDLFPQARYTVVVSRDARRAKVSVGSNPWAPHLREHDISRICERYGGGGHAVVGAVSLAPERLPEARRIAREIADTLRARPGA